MPRTISPTAHPAAVALSDRWARRPLNAMYTPTATSATPIMGAAYEPFNESVNDVIVSSIGVSQSDSQAQLRTAADEFRKKFWTSWPHCPRPVVLRMPHSVAGLQPG